MDFRFSFSLQWHVYGSFDLHSLHSMLGVVINKDKYIYIRIRTIDVLLVLRDCRDKMC